MLEQRRWMVRPEGKQPISAHVSKPADYAPPAGAEDPTELYWKYRWTTPAVWSTHTRAAAVPRMEGLSYVLHPAGDTDETLRLICFDFDKCLDNPFAGHVQDAIDEFLYLANSYTEYSRSGVGLHCFVLVRCPAFRNLLHKPVGDDAHVDVLCSSQIAVTGKPFQGFTALNEVSYEFVQQLPFFSFEPATVDTEHPEWWDNDEYGITEQNEFLIDRMENFTAAVEGDGGQTKLFAAACRILQHGITGHEAAALLAHVPADPPFSEADIQRTLECAYPRVMAEQSFATEGPVNEFPVLGPSKKAKKDKRDKGYGFVPVPVNELMAMDLKLEYLVDRAFVGEGAMFIGGREKTFKTGIAVDLLLSLATGCKFLDEFAVMDTRSSVIFTAEIGMPSAQQLIRRISKAKGIDASKIPGMDVVDSIPRFQVDRNGKPIEQDAINGLKRYLDERKPQVAVFDPLYFAMGGAAVGDMYEVGAVLRLITEICKDRGVWAILCHHARKASKDDEARPMELNDLYGSGVGAYARQWALLSHQEPFANGRANLFLNMGGSAAGDRFVWELTIDEGQADGILDREWNTSIVRRGEDQMIISEPSVLDALRSLGGTKGAGLSDLQFYLNAPQQASVDRILRKLIQEGGSVEMLPGKRFKLREQEDFT
jgi:hypothetical protein